MGLVAEEKAASAAARQLVVLLVDANARLGLGAPTPQATLHETWGGGIRGPREACSVGRKEAEKESPNGKIMREALEKARLVAVNTHQAAGHTYEGPSRDKSRIDYVVTTKEQLGSVDSRVLRGVGHLIWEATVAPTSTRREFMDH